MSSLTPMQAAPMYADGSLLGGALRVLPLHGLSADGHTCACSKRGSCTSPAKHPINRDGSAGATTDMVQIASWSRAYPDANLGVATGGALAVMDVDGPEGVRTLAAFLARNDYPALDTLVVQTGRGQDYRHYYFTIPPGVDVRNAAGVTGPIGPNVVVRGTGGYVAAPPSLHVSGQRYRFVAKRPMAPVPEWLHYRPPAIHEVVPPLPPQYKGAAGTRYGLSALEDELQRLLGAENGTRNHALNRSSFALGQLVSRGHLDQRVVRAALTRAAEQIGLDALEAAKTAGSGLRAGLTQPRGPAA